MECQYVRTRFSIDKWWSGWSRRRLLHEDEIDRMDFSRFLPEIGQGCQLSRGSLELPDISLAEEEVQADLELFPELKRGLDGVRHEAYNVAGETGLRRNINYQTLYAKNWYHRMSVSSICATRKRSREMPPRLAYWI